MNIFIWQIFSHLNYRHAILQEFPVATLCMEYQFHLEEIIDSMCQVYKNKHMNLKSWGRKSVHRIALKVAQQKLKLDLDELDNKFTDARPQMEEYIHEQQEKQLTNRLTLQFINSFIFFHSTQTIGKKQVCSINNTRLYLSPV
jgi:hypothetical protein